MEKSKKDSSVYKQAILTRVDPVELKYDEACMGVICKKLYELIHFLQLYDDN